MHFPFSITNQEVFSEIQTLINLKNELLLIYAIPMYIISISQTSLRYPFSTQQRFIQLYLIKTAPFPFIMTYLCKPASFIRNVCFINLSCAAFTSHTNVKQQRSSKLNLYAHVVYVNTDRHFIHKRKRGSLPWFNVVDIVLRVTNKNVSLSQHSFVGTLLITLSASPALNAISSRLYIAEYSKMVCTCLSGLQFLLGYRLNPVHE